MEESNNHIPMDSLQGSYLPNTTQSSLEIGSSKKDLIDDESEVKEGNVISRLVVSCRRKLHRLYIKNSEIYWLLFKTLLNIALVVYLIAAVLHWYYNGRKPLDWCRGNGMILVLFAFIAWFIIYYKLLKPFVFAYIKQNCCTSFSSFKIVTKIFRIFKRIIIFIVIIGILVFLVLDTVHSRQRLVSAVGLFVFIMLGFIFSQHPNQIKWKTVFMGILIQIVLGLLVIRWEVGRAVFMCIGDRVEMFLQFGYKGATFVYGDFIVNKLAVFAFQALSVIFFLSTVIEICFYFGWLQTICFKLGWIMQTVLGTTIIESVNAVTTVFLGLSEAPLLYKPYIKDLTVSEMHAVMAGGFSTAAGSVFAAYTALGVNPSYVITASIMAAPAALCFAKLLYPETELSKTSVDTFVPYKSDERSVVDAACKGALAAINLVTGIIATVIACVSLVSFIDSAIAWFGSMLGVEGFTFEYLVGKILTPIPYIMGVSPDQCDYVAKLIGIKITLNEFIAYQELGKLRQANLLTPRSEAMATFALCSFSNPGGLASFIALLINLCPQKKDMVTRVAIRALISGITTGLLTATIAGALMPEEGFGLCESCSNSNHTSVTLPIT